MQTKTILFLISNKAQFTELGKLAIYLKKHSDLQPLIYICLSNAQESNSVIQFCEENNIEYILNSNSLIPINRKILFANNGNDFPTNPDLITRIKGRILREIHTSTNLYIKDIICLLLIRKQIQRSHSLIKTWKNIIQEYKPALIVLAEDNLEYGTPELIKACNQSKIPSVIFPYTVANSVEAAEALYQSEEFSLQRPLNWLISKIYPKWSHVYKKTKILRLPFYKIIALEYLKLSPPNPWCFNSGMSTMIAAESQFMKDYYIEAGIFENKIKSIGSMSLDRIHEVLSEKEIHYKILCEKHNLDTKKPLLLCALTTKLSKRQPCGFESYEHYIDSVISTMQTISNFNIVYKLHPNTHNDIFDLLSNQYSVNISTIDTTELIPLCDLFVASVSSTIRWAIACNKDILNYDCYQFGYEDFDSSEKVITVNNFESFQSNLLYMTNTYDHQTKKSIDSQNSYWGEINGGGGKRIIELFQELMQSANQ